MVKRIRLAVMALATTFALSGCAAYALSPVTGFIYTDTKFGVAATSNEGTTKVGESSCESILGIVATGDGSIQAAMKSAAITKVQHVDYHSYSILGIYAKFTVTVYGE